MGRLTITAKIWLSIGVFILGYVLSTALGQVQSNQTRASLDTAAAALFPAAQRSQEAEAAFQRMVKGFGDAVIMQDAGAVEKAAEEGRQTVAALRTIAAIRGLAAGRGQQAAAAADAVERLQEDARKTYSAVLAGQMDASTQKQVRALAGRNEELKTSLGRLKETAAGDLQTSLRVMQAAASRQNTIALVMFAVTLVLASIIVSLTVRRSITGPVLRVIDGVRASADESARTAEEIAQSGSEVSNNAQEQAAFVEETSATLEQISATTRQNADRAGHADKLMQEARQTVDRAANAMNDLTSSMNLISKSSNQVVGVLKTIDEIAFHTNILALNAAVEAARAGEVGAGFSVVADEVRSLAHRAAEAARESGSIVEQTLRDVSRGVELAGLAQRAFQEVSTQISGGSDIVTEIAASSTEQAKGVANIGQAIGRIESVTQQNAANAQKAADGAAAMTTQVENTREYLQHLVELVGTRAV